MPDISTYLQLMDDLIAGSRSAAQFQKAYLTAIKQDQRLIDNEVFYFLQTMFEDADAYVAYPELRTDPEDLNDDQLRECAIRNREGLRALGYH